MTLQVGIPIAAMSYLPARRLFTTGYWGDHLIYKKLRRKVLAKLQIRRTIPFDGRNDFYGPEFAQSNLEIMGAQSGWQQTLARHDLSAALVAGNNWISAALSRDAR